MRTLNQRGDTIIEVLLAMTIIALILTGAYATSSRSLNTSQYSQERTRATRIAESQIEQIKSLEPVNNDPRLTFGAFCIDVNQEDPVLDASVATNCVESFFKTSVTLTGNVYKVVVDWIPPGGSDTIEARANVTLNYLYDVNDSPVVVPTPTEEPEAPPTSEPPVPPTSAPTVTTGSVSSSAYNNVTVSGNLIISDGGEAITQKGVAYSTGQNPTIIDGFAEGPDAETSPFNVYSINALNPNTLYYIRAFATNSKGTAYGNQIAIETGPLTSGGYTANLSGHFEGSDYYFVEYDLTWLQARQVASIAGGHLVTITSKAENDYVVLLTHGRNTWIGLNDRIKEGVWTWDHGTPATYTNWAPGEPNDYTPGEDVVVTWGNGQWNDWFSYTTAPFIIEFEGAPTRK